MCHMWRRVRRCLLYCSIVSVRASSLAPCLGVTGFLGDSHEQEKGGDHKGGSTDGEGGR